MTASMDPNMSTTAQPTTTTAPPAQGNYVPEQLVPPQVEFMPSQAPVAQAQTENGVLNRKLESISNRFRSKTQGDVRISAIDLPKLIEVLGPLLIQLMGNCGKTSAPAAVVQRVKSPRLGDRAMLRLSIRRELDAEPGSRTRRALRNRVTDLMEACIEEGSASSDDEIKAFADEASAFTEMIAD